MELSIEHEQSGLCGFDLLICRRLFRYRAPLAQGDVASIRMIPTQIPLWKGGTAYLTQVIRFSIIFETMSW